MYVDTYYHIRHFLPSIRSSCMYLCFLFKSVVLEAALPSGINKWMDGWRDGWMDEQRRAHLILRMYMALLLIKILVESLGCLVRLNRYGRQ